MDMFTGRENEILLAGARNLVERLRALMVEIPRPRHICILIDGTEATPMPHLEYGLFLRVGCEHLDFILFNYFFQYAFEYSNGQFFEVVDEIHFRGLPDSWMIPPRVSPIFPKIRRCQIVNCKSLFDLRSLRQFRVLEELAFIDCPCLTRVSKLNYSLTTTILKSVNFVRCGLNHWGDWDSGMDAIARAKMRQPGIFSLTIIECHNLHRLPTAVERLITNAQDRVMIVVKRNNNLSTIPCTLRNLYNAHISIFIMQCPGIYAIPFGLHRTGGATNFHIGLCLQPFLIDHFNRLGVRPDVHYMYDGWYNVYPFQRLAPYFRQFGA